MPTITPSEETITSEEIITTEVFILVEEELLRKVLKKVRKRNVKLDKNVKRDINEKHEEVVNK